VKQTRKKTVKRIEREDQSRNGVKVIVTRFRDNLGVSGTTVEADCNCFGHPMRACSSSQCPMLTKSP
jgi:hypothetical protein